MDSMRKSALPCPHRTSLIRSCPNADPCTAAAAAPVAGSQAAWAGCQQGWLAAGPVEGMLVAAAAQGVHARRVCGKIAFEIPIPRGSNDFRSG
jgi:hypothetical protein